MGINYHWLYQKVRMKLEKLGKLLKKEESDITI